MEHGCRKRGGHVFCHTRSAAGTAPRFTAAEFLTLPRWRILHSARKLDVRTKRGGMNVNSDVDDLIFGADGEYESER